MTTLLDNILADDVITSLKKTIGENPYNMGLYNYTISKISNNEDMSSAQHLQNNQRYKVGDHVRIISKGWYDMHKRDDGSAIFGDDTITFVKQMSYFCGMNAVITKVIQKMDIVIIILILMTEHFLGRIIC